MLARALSPEAWEGVLRDLGRRRILSMPMAVLGLTISTENRVMRHFGSATVRDVAGLSEATLRQHHDFHFSQVDGIISRLGLFGLTLRP